MSHTGDELIAVVYEIGGRHRSSERTEREVHASELADPEPGAPVPDAVARAAYRQRLASRAARRGGGS
jgi:hypothetical protein